MKLTPNRLAVLKAIDRLTNEVEAAPATPFYIADRCGRTVDRSDWAHAKVRALSEAGLIRSAGGWRGSTKWALTAKGKRVLAEAEGEKNG